MASYKGFRFTNNNGFEHLTAAVVFQAVADENRKNNLNKGECVVALAKRKEDGLYVAIMGFATGCQSKFDSKTIWPNWDRKSASVHEVKWVSGPVTIPHDIAARGGITMSPEHTSLIVDYILQNT